MNETDLSDVASLLFITGQQMQTDARMAERLPDGRKAFLIAWGRLLQANGEWVITQHQAGVLPEAEILGMVQTHLDVARTYDQARRLVPA